MERYRRQVWINVAPEKVFDAIDTPDTWRVIVPSMHDAEATELDDGGYRLDFIYKLAGVKIKRALETSESKSDTRREFELTKGITGSYTFDIEEQGTGTRVQFGAEYAFSSRVHDKITRRFAGQYITRQFDDLLANLKHYLEAEAAEAASESTA